ncbi:MAG: Ig-like domain-containing protein, partial [Verrucomicrobiota bacterium]
LEQAGLPGAPPTIALSANFQLEPPRAEEGKLVRVVAEVEDDVQVRNVEFYIDGVKAATDGNYPFVHRFITPRIADQPTFRLRARASDTGGHATWTDERVVTLLDDVSGPRVAGVSPALNSFQGSLPTLAVTFDEPIDSNTLTATSFELFDAGPDGLADTGDDIPVNGGLLTWREDVLTAFMTFGTGLPPGFYRGVVGPPLADLSGNARTNVFSWTFRVFDIGADRDGDGVPDGVEVVLGLDPDDPDSDDNGVNDGLEDFDSDNLNNFGEVLLGYDPTDPDSDDDSVLDGDEDRDYDGILDITEVLVYGTSHLIGDSDGDGFGDGDEVNADSDPLDDGSLPIDPNLPEYAALADGVARLAFSVMNAVHPSEHESPPAYSNLTAAVSPGFSVLNSVHPTAPGPGEDSLSVYTNLTAAASPGFSLLNRVNPTEPDPGEDPPAAYSNLNAVVSPGFSVLNLTDPTAPGPGEESPPVYSNLAAAVSSGFSVLNLTDPTSAGPGEDPNPVYTNLTTAVSPAFSVLNTNDMSSIQHEN